LATKGDCLLASGQWRELGELRTKNPHRKFWHRGQTLIPAVHCVVEWNPQLANAADDNRRFDHYGHTMIEPTTHVPTLDTARLRLRRLKIEDASAAHRAYGDPAAMRYWDMPPSIDVEETERRLTRSLSVDPQWHATWTVLARPDGQLADDQFIGMVNYHARQPWNRRLALGWILILHFEGRGYMQEAVSAVLSHCFATLNTHRVEAEIEPENVRSARLAQRLGFQREGVLRDRLFVANQPRTKQMYALLSSDWAS
jgi:[ribosomal protein S5]-alanine N-acetyltransferase